MMKKLFTLSAITAAVMLGGQAHAAPTSLPASGLLTPLECGTLDNNVTIQISENVNAAYNCGAVATSDSFVAATCHNAGTNKSTTQTCGWTEDGDGDDTTGVPNFSACGTTVGGVATITYEGRVGFRGASGGGTVSETELTADSCTGPSDTVPTVTGGTVEDMVPDTALPGTP